MTKDTYVEGVRDLFWQTEVGRGIDGKRRQPRAGAPHRSMLP
jgi:hypothetical protein